MKKVFQSVDIPVFTMIRPHSFSFVYDETDFEIIEEDVRSVLELGGTRIAFGALHEDGTINEEMLQRLLDTPPSIEMTFQRASDSARDQIDAYKMLVKYDEVKCILTSSGADTCTEGKDMLRKLVD